MNIKGIISASLSILNQDLSLDIDSTIKHSEKLIQDGCHGCVLFGSTGQAQLISSDEKKRLIEKLSGSEFKKNFIIGTGNNSLKENIDLMKHGIKHGLEHFLLMPPAYYKYDDSGVHYFFSKVIQQVPSAKIICYNFEKLSGYKFSIKIVENLVKEFPKQIIGIKDSTYNLYETLKIPNFLIFPGSELKLVEGLKIGNSGIISATCNVTAGLARKVYDDFNNNNTQNFNKKLCEVRKVFDNYNLISGLHSFLSVENKKYNKVLPPLSLLPEDKQKELINSLKKLDFLPEKNMAA
jgi:4-hydroxy-tetrahydrodipicolinate synthase